MVNNGVPRVQKYQNTKLPTEKVERRFMIRTETDQSLDRLALVLGIPRGQVIDIMTDSMTAVYTTFVHLTGEKPEFDTLNDVISSLLLNKPL